MTWFEESNGEEVDYHEQINPKEVAAALLPFSRFTNTYEGYVQISLAKLLLLKEYRSRLRWIIFQGSVQHAV